MVTVLSLPDIPGWQSLNFDPVRPRVTDRMEGRRTEALVHATSWWRATFRAPFLEKRDYGKLDAFMMRAGDNGEVFRAHDPERPRPMAHDNGQPLAGVRAGGGAFDGTANLLEIDDPFSVTVSGLPAGFQLRQGDYVEFAMSETVISLHRIMADATADEDGEVALAIRYGLDLQHFDLDATVNFEKPSCLMQIDPGSFEGNKARLQRSPSFSAQEVFLP